MSEKEGSEEARAPEAPKPSTAVASQGLRVAIHVAFAWVPLIYLATGWSRWTMLAVGLPALAGIGFDLWRINSPGLNEFVLSLWGRLLKAQESSKLTGASHYFIGILGAVLLYPKPVAVCASLYMTWADPAAVVVGRRFGRHSLGDKSWEGFGAFVAAAFLIGLYFFRWPAALVGATVAALVELYSPGWANDNSLIPIVSGLALAILT